MRERPPVTDWASDFDPLDPAWINDPFPIWAALRKGCRSHHRPLHGRVLSQPLRRCARDRLRHRAFSSRRVIVRETLPPRFPTEPITSDPPVHPAERRVLLPAFTPERVSRLEPRARALCNELIDRFINQPEVDAAIAYAQEIPARLTAHLLGLPEQDGELYRRFIAALLEDGITDRAVDGRRRGIGPVLSPACAGAQTGAGR